jgi:hypothetical protein
MMVSMSHVGYGGRRGGRPLWVAGGVLVALALVMVAALGGYAVGHHTAEPAKPFSGNDVTRQVSPQWPGATYIDAKGYPAGWPDTKLGAMQAASEIWQVANLAQGGSTGQNDAKYQGSVGESALDSYSDQVTNLLYPPGTPVYSALLTRPYPFGGGTAVAYHVDSWSGDQLVIEIWGEVTSGVPYTIPPTTIWTTTIFTAKWSSTELAIPGQVPHDWLITATSLGRGPQPQLSPATPASGYDLPPQLLAWKRYGVAAGV